VADPRVSLSAKGALRRVHPDARAGVATPAAWTGGPGRFLLDSLPAMTVIVDERGDVAAANEAWRRFGRENGAGPAVAEGVGQNYFAICGDAVMAGCPPDARAVAGIKRVLRGELPVFTLDYAGQGSVAERWFMLTVTPLDGGGAVIAHTDITARRRTEMSAAALVETGRELAGGLDPAEVARQIACTVVRVFGTQHAALYRLDSEVARLVCIAAAGLGEPEDWRGQTVGVGEGIVGRAAAEERSVWTPDVLEDSRIDLAARAGERVTADGFRSVLAVPLKAGERVIGGAEPGRRGGPDLYRGRADLAGRLRGPRRGRPGELGPVPGDPRRARLPAVHHRELAGRHHHHRWSGAPDLFQPGGRGDVRLPRGEDDR